MRGLLVWNLRSYNKRIMFMNFNDGVSDLCAAKCVEVCFLHTWLKIFKHELPRHVKRLNWNAFNSLLGSLTLANNMLTHIQFILNGSKCRICDCACALWVWNPKEMEMGRRRSRYHPRQPRVYLYVQIARLNILICLGRKKIKHSKLVKARNWLVNMVFVLWEREGMAILD